MADISKNKSVDVPVFDLNESPRVDFTITKITTGFIVIDQTKQSSHAITDSEDIGEMLGYVTISLKEAIIKALNNKKVGEDIEVLVILNTETETKQFEPNIPDEPMELSVDEITELVNEALAGRMSPYRQFGVSRQPRVVTTGMLQDFITGPGMARIKLRLKSQTGRGEKDQSANRDVVFKAKDKKEFHDKSQNKEQEEKKHDDEVDRRKL